MPSPVSNFTLNTPKNWLDTPKNTSNKLPKIKQRKDTPHMESSSQKANTSDYGSGVFCALSYRILSFGHEKTSPLMALPPSPVDSHKVHKMQRPPRGVMLSGSRTDGLLPI